ncbi:MULTISPECIES: CBS domain-containing protein [Thermotoga]|jgi:CBS domain-containing protein|uniref:Putative signal-transduction protein with CBS domains n=2 Tax=Thermotoga petrophila TaxID=93929 RepID=A5INN4_THEP1|nr:MULTISPECIES: CBS domain-containing protein [Thermotoga]MBZ4662295.1 putative signal transduction protein with domain [Thermotoga sp.]ABQ47807.1 putative signal-transduction protein with CBS domains [Thermotoga petrophila RKU-1]ADA67869.1 putative signal transduction protein with CBS domains [Thermotoga petrophila RKU-10]AIY89056.1 putative signal transduction protein with CBS domains [Thermotoga sp. Cell2]KHC93227.1 putative signal transduction protein with CBS domains [Thermotoga sp. TBGT
MKVKDVCKLISLKPTVVEEDTPIEEIVDRILEDPVTRTVYVARDNKLVGMIPVMHLLKVSGFHFFGFIPKEELIRSSMKRLIAKNASEIMLDPVYVHMDTTLEEALKLMIDNNIQEMPVVDEKGEIVGDLNSLEILLALWKGREK